MWLFALCYFLRRHLDLMHFKLFLNILKLSSLYFSSSPHDLSRGLITCSLSDWHDWRDVYVEMLCVWWGVAGKLLCCQSRDGMMAVKKVVVFRASLRKLGSVCCPSLPFPSGWGFILLQFMHSLLHVGSVISLFCLSSHLLPLWLPSVALWRTSASAAFCHLYLIDSHFVSCFPLWGNVLFMMTYCFHSSSCTAYVGVNIY